MMTTMKIMIDYVYIGMYAFSPADAASDIDDAIPQVFLFGRMIKDRRRVILNFIAPPARHGEVEVAPLPRFSGSWFVPSSQ